MTGVRTAATDTDNSLVPFQKQSLEMLVSTRNLIRDVNGSLLKGADAREEEGGMENDYWISVIQTRASLEGSVPSLVLRLQIRPASIEGSS